MVIAKKVGLEVLDCNKGEQFIRKYVVSPGYDNIDVISFNLYNVPNSILLGLRTSSGRHG